MYNVSLNGLSIETLESMKKRIKSCRDSKNNDITNTFTDLELDFFENCIDIAINQEAGCVLNKRYALSTKPNEFKSCIKYLYSIIDNINDYAELLVIDSLGKVYMCESHNPYRLGGIENDTVIGRFLGTTTLPNLSKDIIETKKNDITTETGVSYILFTFDDNLNVKTCLSKQNVVYDIRPVSEIDFIKCVEFEKNIINILVNNIKNK